MKKNILESTDALIAELSIPPRANPIGVLVHEWIHVLRDRGLHFHTLKNHYYALANLARFVSARGYERLETLLPENLSAWQRHLGENNLKPGTVAHYTQVVRDLFNWLASLGRVFENPAEMLPAPKVPRIMGAFPSENEMTRLIGSMEGSAALAYRDRALIELAYSTGARLQELHRLDMASLDFDASQVRLYGKGSRERVTPLTSAACEKLIHYIERARPHLARAGKAGEALFVSRRGHRLSPVTIAYAIKSRGRASGLENLTPHAIRRACATHLLRGGMPLAHVKDLLGHQTYSHLRHYLEKSGVALAGARQAKPLAR